MSRQSPFHCCSHCGCAPIDRRGHYIRCRQGCNDYESDDTQPRKIASVTDDASEPMPDNDAIFGQPRHRKAGSECSRCGEPWPCAASGSASGQTPDAGRG